MVMDHGFFGAAKPVTDDLDVGGCQLQAAGSQGPGSLRRVQDDGALGNFVDQAAALKQRPQRLFRLQVAGDRWRLLARHQLGAEEQLQRSLLAQLAQRRSQRLGLDLDAGRRRGGMAAGDTAADSQCQGQGQPAGRTRGNVVVVHVVERS
ncbi:hypothetical protein D3C80_957860 [compost metagenome]